MKYTLYYWGKCTKFYGRGLPILLALDLAKQEYEIKETSEAPEGVDCFAVPYVTFTNGVTVSQLCPILQIIGEEHGLAGSTVEEKMKAKQYLGDLSDVLAETFAGKLSGDGVSRADTWFTLLSNRLDATGYYIGSSLSVVDFFAYFVFLWVVKQGIPFEKFENLTKFITMMNEKEVLQKYIASGVPLIP
jgi:glutathione S-transferase